MWTIISLAGKARRNESDRSRALPRACGRFAKMRPPHSPFSKYDQWAGPALKCRIYPQATELHFISVRCHYFLAIRNSSCMLIVLFVVDLRGTEVKHLFSGPPIISGYFWDTLNFMECFTIWGPLFGDTTNNQSRCRS